MVNFFKLFINTVRARTSTQQTTLSKTTTPNKLATVNNVDAISPTYPMSTNKGTVLVDSNGNPVASTTPDLYSGGGGGSSRNRSSSRASTSSTPLTSAPLLQPTPQYNNIIYANQKNKLKPASAPSFRRNFESGYREAQPVPAQNMSVQYAPIDLVLKPAPTFTEQLAASTVKYGGFQRGSVGFVAEKIQGKIGEIELKTSPRGQSLAATGAISQGLQIAPYFLPGGIGAAYAASTSAETLFTKKGQAYLGRSANELSSSTGLSPTLASGTVIGLEATGLLGGSSFLALKANNKLAKTKTEFLEMTTKENYLPDTIIIGNKASDISTSVGIASTKVKKPFGSKEFISGFSAENIITPVSKNLFRVQSKSKVVSQSTELLSQPKVYTTASQGAAEKQLLRIGGVNKKGFGIETLSTAQRYGKERGQLSYYYKIGDQQLFGIQGKGLRQGKNIFSVSRTYRNGNKNINKPDLISFGLTRANRGNKTKESFNFFHTGGKSKAAIPFTVDTQSFFNKAENTFNPKGRIIINPSIKLASKPISTQDISKELIKNNINTAVLAAQPTYKTLGMSVKTISATRTASPTRQQVKINQGQIIKSNFANKILPVESQDSHQRDKVIPKLRSQPKVKTGQKEIVIPRLTSVSSSKTKQRISVPTIKTPTPTQSKRPVGFGVGLPLFSQGRGKAKAKLPKFMRSSIPKVKRSPSLAAIGLNIKSSSRGRAESSALTLRPILTAKRKSKRGKR